MEILQGEIKSLHTVKERLKQRVIDLEEELRKTKEEAEKQKAKFEEEVTFSEFCCKSYCVC